MLSIVRVLPLLAVLLAAPSAMAQDAAFPITLEHALGTVTIPAEPQRVVALIDRDADTVLALGVQPVGIRSNYNFDAGVGPWAEPLLTTEPAVWKGRELNFEAIAAADPDLIVFATSGGDAAEYERLSQIAPTIALPRGANPWEATTAQTTLLIAEALGRKQEGEQLIADLDAYLATQKAAHPEFAGRTVNYLDIYPGGISSYSANHIVNGMLYATGFSPIAGALDVPAGQSSISVSAELLASYDADIVLIYPFGRSLDELIAETPTLATLPSVEDGRAFVLQDLAFSSASVVSIPYALDNLLPRFSAALAD
ncbi:iron-siderophore ABC transporter substrate-binding protein [Devosia ginsengisoli]|uniref:ABC transporter substrate-binding protein n=1 Tax=Devosia ginsengisoli TaxID=400770 RepID=UPI0026E9430D|nr:iron-siderophore ABC transporter substrate-binding protein [Devosia ginsengisoli]MCR6671823.1 iron-siderophore ABC transporter substrate-binding protein [Devosia ginsengisoli]